jgi:frataxin-like iron-binding protein CyaY
MFSRRLSILRSPKALSLYKRTLSVQGVSRKARKTLASQTLVYNFKDKATEALVSIEKALSPLTPLNDVFEINRVSDDELSVDTGKKGKYIFRVDHENTQLFVASPMSGNFNYSYDPASGYWLGTNDNHDMRGLVTRDLLRHCTGLPDFD